MSLIFAGALALLAGCAETPRAAYDCLRAAPPPALDGDLADPCWARAQRGEVGAAAGFRLLWDDVYLYFAAEVCDATPRAVGAVRDDHVWEGDCFELFLNPEDRPGEYYEIDFNSKGVIWDSLWLRRRSGDLRILRSWTAPSLECRAVEREGGWTLEGRVRLDEFVNAPHTPPRHGDLWRFNANYLDAPAGKGGQTVSSWSPTSDISDTRRFGALRFVDPESQAQEAAARRLALDRLRPEVLEKAEPLAERLAEAVVTAQSGVPFKPVDKGPGWFLPGGFGRLTPRASAPGGPPGLLRAQPADVADAMCVEFAAWKSGSLLLAGRLEDSGARRVEAGQGDGVWLLAEAAGERRAQLRLAGRDWLAAEFPVRRGQIVRVTVSTGPAANLGGDFAALGIYLLPEPETAPPQPPPDGWEAFGDVASIHTAESAVTRIDAGGTFTGLSRWLPHREGRTLYRITGRVRVDLAGTTKAHVGVDYYDADKGFLRQACTRAPLNVHMRWGLYNVSGRTAWSRFAAYAYDVPKKAAWLKLWLGVNAWETPEAAGSAWFDDVRIEAVDPDPAWPLGFPPARWQPSRAPEWPPEAQQEGYVLSAVSCLDYLLPEWTPPAASAREIGAFSLPGWKEPLSFTLHALREMPGVKVEVSDLLLPGEGGARIPADRVAVRRVRYIYKNRDLLSNEYLLSPNHLEPFDSADVAAGRTQQFWLTVDVPREARPGRYEGRLRVAPAAAPARELRLFLEVLPARVPEPSGVMLGLYSNYGRRDTKAKLAPEFRDMRDHGMTTTFSFDASMTIPIEKAQGAPPRILWNEANQLQDLLEAYKEAGFSMPLRLLAPTALFTAAETHGGPPGSAEFAAVYRDLWTQVLAERKRRNWPELVVAPYDEGYPYPFTGERFQMTRVLSAVLKAAGVPIAVHAVNHPTPAAARFEKEFYPVVDEILLTYCHPPVTVSESYRGFRDWAAYRTRVQGDGKKLLFYNVDCTGVHPEVMRFSYGVGLWARGADGIIDWHYSESPRDGGYAVSRVQGSSVLGLAFTPAKGYLGGPTIGWEGVREGVKDYALLRALRTLTDRAAQSPDAALRAAGERAAREVQAVIARLRFSTLDSSSLLSLPARFEHESWDETGAKFLGGRFKLANGFALEDYDRLRRLGCEHILRLDSAAASR
jgi:hypothetical protein